MRFLQLISSVTFASVPLSRLALAASEESVDNSVSSSNSPNAMLYLEAGIESLTYQDEQKTSASPQMKESEKISLKGRKINLKLPLIRGFTGEASLWQYSPSAPYWVQETISEARLSYQIASLPVSLFGGGHWEFSKYDLSRRDAPEIALTGVRAHIIGAETRLKLLSNYLSTDLGISGEFGLLNANKANDRGQQLRLGLLATYEAFVECSLKMFDSKYQKTEEDLIHDNGTVSIQRKLKGFSFEVGLWL
jgi:hypothetical protein